MVATGHVRRQNLHTVGLLDLDQSKTSQLTPLPVGVMNAAGGLILVEGKATPVVCGGWNIDGGSDKCYGLMAGSCLNLEPLSYSVNFPTTGLWL